MSDFLEFTYQSGSDKTIAGTTIYIQDIKELELKYEGAFSQAELDRACQAVMSHYARPGLLTMQKLLANEKVIVRDFIRELGKLLPDV